MESAVHSSLHPNYHNQIIYPKFNLQIYYLRQYYREIWHDNDSNIELIRRAVDLFNQGKAKIRQNKNITVE